MTETTADSAQYAIDVADWRRRIHALYREVRAAGERAEAGDEAAIEAAHDLWRRTRDDVFATHPSTPLLPDDRPGFTGLPTTPYDPAWRFEVEIQPAEAHRMIVPTGTDGDVPFDRIGLVDVPGVGRLDVWRLASYGGGIFVPVKDALAGKPGGTYGGGRYLIDTVKGADLGAGAAARSLVLDFNFAYNPSCAYDPAWACPLAQPGNTVPVEIPVGERYDGAY
ncbi:DUF1684 domain-containing protein [Frondihabitans australicus]|uniref:DUF1684 domain-containing protein n=1 Tax=Frondihabitans australicus TaxID=386892 RepID=A0A495IHY6_9MICO|nr:DUF1684 domain-containing protein [Frondihabitans australicus]RKR75593.1 hypothetical protein C8E83_2741 [Frondihabitans australicus]